MTICDLCYEHGTVNTDAPETCLECGADMCPQHGVGEYCSHCLALESRETELQLATA